MSTPKHTPGPWRWLEGDGYCGPRLVDASVEDVIGGGAQIDDTGVYTSPANARLIAAAPELLEELESLVERSGDLDGFSDEYYRSEMRSRIESARGIVARATGGDR